MPPQPIKTQSILPRLDGIARDVGMLRTLGKLPPQEFVREENFIRAQFYLRRALEGVFHSGSHVLSRIPGGRVTEYKGITTRLGEVGVVTRDFARDSLKPMAGYRNRLTHFYADVQPEEIQRIINQKLGDFDRFAAAVKHLLQHPDDFGLTIE